LFFEKKIKNNFAKKKRKARIMMKVERYWRKDLEKEIKK